MFKVGIVLIDCETLILDTLINSCHYPETNGSAAAFEETARQHKLKADPVPHPLEEEDSI